jgi:polyphosphate kinase
MRMEESLNLSIETPEAFERVANAPLPFGLRASPESRQQFRDTYFDTPDRQLRARGIVCRLRVQPQQVPLLVLTIEDHTRGAGLVLRRSFETLAVTNGVFEAFNGTSEPARRMRALIDPAALRPVAAVEVERRIRQARSGWLRRACFEISCDTLRIEGGGVSRNVYELNLVRLRNGGPAVAAIGQELQQHPGVHQPKSDTLGRIFEVLSAGIDDQPRHAEHTGTPEIALFVLDGNRAAFQVRDGELVVPNQTGAGKARCIEMLRRVTQQDAALRLLTTVSADSDRVRLEVWVAQLEGPPDNGAFHWICIDRLLQHIGRPGLRNRRTIAALATLSRDLVIRDACARGAGSMSAEWRPGTVIGLPEEKPEKHDRYLNAELSFLDFNARVLDLADDARVPLLERVRYLSIFSSNLDEFFMVHVASLHRMAREQKIEQGDDGFRADEVLEVIAGRVRGMLTREAAVLQDTFAALSAAGIHLRKWGELPAQQQARLREYFEAEIFPVLTPNALTVSPGHPFPHLPGLGLSVAAVLRDPSGRRMHFSHLRLPGNLPRFLPAGGPIEFILLEDVVIANAAALFPGFTVDSAHALRVIRSADTRIDESNVTNLVDAVEREVRERPFRPVVGIEVSRDMPQIARELLLRELRQETGAQAGLNEHHVYAADRPLQLQDLAQIADLDIPELHFPKVETRDPLPAEDSLFDVLKQREVLVHMPYERFDRSVLRFFDESADDPAVVSIKVSLYRAARDSRVVDALVRAASTGKEVVVFVELKARFDEANNLLWLQRLQRAGIAVVYGIVGFKMHGKVALVTRREDGRVQRYCYIGTGNFNEATARFYSDLGLLSGDAALTADLADLFNALTGTSRPPRTASRRLLVAPNDMLQRFVQLIDREIEHAKAGRPSGIRIKVNGLNDTEIVNALYRASKAGVQVDLIVRGLCTLRPGVPGLSDRIRVFSILGRYLEHARIFAFRNGGKEEFYIGSADLRPRNLRRRVEIITPVLAPELRRRLDSILNCELEDECAWELGPDGAYYRRRSDVSGVSAAQQQFAGLGTETAPVPV